ncbi:hypothetical protein GF412_01890 [Candidatus Micrarchaeota archaeon]|nr:hypothetical protein [Candidatus Micrarchaeota archaeon]MBD3417713.1 hypothetical protein [Candidatus Micrarchaeota archaeon]
MGSRELEMPGKTGEVEVLKLPGEKKVLRQFDRAMKKAIKDFTNVGRASLEKKGGVPTNKKLENIAKDLGYWNDEEGKIDDINEFMAKVQKILIGAHNGIKTTVPALYKEVSSKNRPCSAQAYANTDHIGIDAGTLKKTLEIFNKFFNQKYGIEHRTGGEEHGTGEKGRVPITLKDVSIDEDTEGIRWATVELDWSDDRYFKETQDYAALVPKKKEPSEFRKKHA